MTAILGSTTHPVLEGHHLISRVENDKKTETKYSHTYPHLIQIKWCPIVCQVGYITTR